MPKGTYLVTGAAGFIGARVAGLLLKRGDRVVGVDDLNEAYDPRLKRFRLEELTQEIRFEFRRIDIADLTALASVFRDVQFDAVLNLAAQAGIRRSQEDPFGYLRVNSLGALNVLQSMVRHGVKKLVLASTSSLYAGDDIPFREDSPANRPLSPYAASKKGAEAMAHAFHFMQGLNVTVLRYFTVYGPGGRPDMSIFRFVQQIAGGNPIRLFGDGTQSRDITYIDDAARATVSALPLPGYEIVNVGGGKTPISLNALIEQIESRLGKRAVVERCPVHPLDLRTAQADISKAARLLDWRPEYTVADGLAKTVDWHRANREWLSRIDF